MQEPIGVPLPVPPELMEQMRERAGQFRTQLQMLLNRFSCENGCDTPDWILAEYLRACLAAFDAGVVAREKWYGRNAGGRSIPPQAVSLSSPQREAQ